MWRDRLSTFRSFLLPRMAGGEVIPPDARVNPEDFPEEHFPLFCPDCNYPLRGLPDDRCPECGRPFDRGRLLVEQYVIERGRRLWKRRSKYAKWTFLIGLLLMVFAVLIGLGIVLLEPRIAQMTNPLRTLDRMAASFSFLLLIKCVGVVLLIVSCALNWRLASAGRKKHTEVLRGIDRSVPSFQAAQRPKWMVFVLCLIGLLPLLFWGVSSRSDPYRYYARHPSRLLGTFGLAVGIVALFVIGRWLWRRWRRRHGDHRSRKED